MLITGYEVNFLADVGNRCVLTTTSFSWNCDLSGVFQEALCFMGDKGLEELDHKRCDEVHWALVAARHILVCYERDFAQFVKDDAVRLLDGLITACKNMPLAYVKAKYRRTK